MRAFKTDQVGTIGRGLNYSLYPDYILKNRLNVDYGHYITNQIMKPILQIYSLVLFDLPCIKSKPLLVKRIKKQINELSNMPLDIFRKKEEQIKNKYVQQYIFNEYIQKSENKKNNTKEITSYFS